MRRRNSNQDWGASLPSNGDALSSAIQRIRLGENPRDPHELMDNLGTPPRSN